MSATQLARADDTEVYTGQPTTTAEGRPNIMFVIDTSGSMGTKVKTQEAYDPSETYSGSCTDATAVFWKTSTASIGAEPPVDKDCKLRSTSAGNSVGRVDGTAFVCKWAADVMARNGFHAVSKAAQWQPRKKASNNMWEALRSADQTNYVECAEDSDATKMNPAHGNGTKPYPANGTSGPFSDDETQKITWGSSASTNVAYTFYNANYLNWYFNSRIVEKTRLEIIQDVAEKTLDALSNVNVGLMRFSSDASGGMVLHEIADIATARSTLIKQVQDLDANGNTPLSETMYEAHQYFAGKTWDYGSRSSPVHSTDNSLLADKTTYKSPVTSSCQKNFIVYLTDGEPTSDTGADSSSRILGLKDATGKDFKTLTGNSSAACTNTTASNNTNGRCLDDLAAFMQNGDLSSEPGKQNVTTYTVGFGADVQSVGWAIDLLKETAKRGGGTFYEAKDTASLTAVFTNIVQEILGINTTFTAPTVSVNAFNRTQNLNDLFITVFRASDKYHWPGNVKKYEVRTDGTVVGSNGPAVDPATGFFKKTARSFWSDADDGDEVSAGGAAHRIPDPATRVVFTDVNSNDLATDSANKVISTNDKITDDMLGGLATDLTHEELVNWIRGADVDALDPLDRAKPRFVMGDPLHARPTTVIYGGSASNPDMVLFSSTNDGQLHAINPATGAELWSYIPGPMLRRMTDLYLNKPQSIKRYGLDGSLRVLKIDINDNGAVDGSDRVLLFFGMGRGGSSYYALDVTNKAEPKLLWRRGGAAEINADGTPIAATQLLAGLGQTWSTPVPTRVKIGSTVRTVLVVGGGYDPTQDNVGYNTDDIGNVVYMLDAFTGELVWSTANVVFPTGVAMQHSIPADVRVLDLDNNGLADRMYVADTGARIWRFDIFNGNPKESLVTGGKFASLGRADGLGTSPTDARRFYYAPDVSLVRDGMQTYLNLAIGSGYRGHPLNREIHDRFYSVRDYLPFAQKSQSAHDAFATISEATASLVDVTTTLTPTIPLGAAGWRINLLLANGEKVLGESRTFDNKILFSSYMPNLGNLVPSANSCVARQGLNRLYVVSAKDGSPVTNSDNSTGPDGTPNKNPDEVDDRWDDLAQSGIAPEPVILFPETSTPTCIVGVESCGVSLTNDPVRTFWNRRDTDISN